MAMFSSPKDITQSLGFALLLALSSVPSTSMTRRRSQHHSFPQASLSISLCIQLLWSYATRQSCSGVRTAVQGLARPSTMHRRGSGLLPHRLGEMSHLPFFSKSWPPTACITIALPAALPFATCHEPRIHTQPSKAQQIPGCLRKQAVTGPQGNG